MNTAVSCVKYFKAKLFVLTFWYHLKQFWAHW